MASKGQRKKIKASFHPKKRGNKILWVVTLLVGAGLIAMAIFIFSNRENGYTDATDSQTAQKPADSRTKSANDFKEARSLTGRWIRPDGGYVIEIRNVDPSGNMDVGYYNPRSINVSRAKASKVGADTQLFIELRDTGYPGATYTLVYNRQNDVLAGLYYQPAAGQTFDVIFIRMKGK
jgi:hypothetical protein